MIPRSMGTTRLLQAINVPIRNLNPQQYWRVALIIVGYLAGTVLGLFLTRSGHAIAVLWPPNAILLAALLLVRLRDWPLSLLGVLVVHVFVQSLHNIPLTTSIGWYVTNVSEAVIAAVLINHFVKPDEIFSTFRGIISFISFGVFLSPFVTSFMDAGVVVGTGFGHDYWHLWQDRFCSNVLSILMFVPPIVVAGSLKGVKPAVIQSKWPEFAVLCLLTCFVTYLTHGTGLADTYDNSDVYLLLPMVFWAALRFGCAGVSGTLLLSGLLTIWYASAQSGAIAELRSLQAFLIAFNLPLLCLAAVLEERHHTVSKLTCQQGLLGIISETAVTCVNLPWEKVDTAINHCLHQLSVFLGADRVSVFLVDGDTLSARYSVADREVGYAVHRRRKVAWLLEHIHELDVAVIDSESQPGSPLLEGGLHTVVLVPIKQEVSVYGALTIISTSELRMPVKSLLPMLGVFGDIVHDAVQRRDALQAMEESEERFREIADEAPIFIWITDRTGKCTYVNRAWVEFTGVDFAQHHKSGWQESIHPENIDAVTQLLLEAHASQERFSAEYRARRKDGTYRWIFDIGAPRFNSSGVFLGLVGSAIDITERINTEQMMQSFSGRLIYAQESERIRIARELHDDIGQQIALMCIELDQMRKTADPENAIILTKLLQQADTLSQTTRHIAHGLHSATLDLLSLESSLNRLCKDFAEAGLNLSFSVNGDLRGISSDVKICLYRVAQTALQNVLKHADADAATLRLSAENDELRLVVEDDGKGFDPTSPSAGLGIQSIRERLRVLGGSLEVTSNRGSGTRLEVRVARAAQASDDALAAA